MSPDVAPVTVIGRSLDVRVAVIGKSRVAEAEISCFHESVPELFDVRTASPSWVADVAGLVAAVGHVYETLRIRDRSPFELTWKSAFQLLF